MKSKRAPAKRKPRTATEPFADIKKAINAFDAALTTYINSEEHWERRLTLKEREARWSEYLAETGTASKACAAAWSRLFDLVASAGKAGVIYRGRFYDAGGRPDINHFGDTWEFAQAVTPLTMVLNLDQEGSNNRP